MALHDSKVAAKVAGTKRAPETMISLQTLSTKVTEKESWLAFDGIVYDVTTWISKHPGGAGAILSRVGKDATPLIRAMHSPKTIARIKTMVKRVGILDVVDEQTMDAAHKRNQAIEKDFALLHDHVTHMGWYSKSPLSYWADVLRVAGFLLLGIFLVNQGEIKLIDGDINSFVYRVVCLILGSVLLGAFLQNVAFMGHDTGHNAITGDKTKDFCIGLVIGNALTGVSMSWWKSTHNAHHIATNALQDDPDIQHTPIFCFDAKLANKLWSTYHSRFQGLDSFGRVLVQYQHLYFYPVLAVARINLYIQSLLHLYELCPFVSQSTKSLSLDETKQQPQIKWKPKASAGSWIAEVIGLATFYILTASLVISLGPTNGPICLFVSHVAAGMLHVQILLSHLAMETCMDASLSRPKGEEDLEKVGFYEWQALSTMDIACPRWMDWFHGGLQFQLEHHLFPRVHKKNLVKLMPLTDEIFAKYDIPVVRMGFYEANLLALKHMASVGKAISDGDKLVKSQ
jgi:fatty acid desaturase